MGQRESSSVHICRYAQSGHLWATLPQLTQSPSGVTEAVLLCYERKAGTWWPRQDGVMGAARASGQPPTFSHSLPSFREQQAQFLPAPRHRKRNGVTVTPTPEETPREGSHLSPALSSSSVLSLLPNTHVSPELLFKIK